MMWQTITDDREKYQAYLASREWALMRNKVIARSGGICERCKVNRMDHVHHMTYIRKYNEKPEDLRALCKPCHDFTHGKSHTDPLRMVPAMFDGRVIKSIYLAGTCEPSFIRTDEDGDEMNWRHSITEAYFVGHKENAPSSSHGFVQLSSGKKLAYTGPFIEYDHCCCSNESHGSVYRSKEETIRDATNAIIRADLVFAWIDRQDCFGTLAEIGFARGIGKSVVVAGPASNPEMWFVERMAAAALFGIQCPRVALEHFVK